jgi:hypothetical protein
MGCCHYKDEIKIPSIKPNTISTETVREKFTYFLDVFINDYQSWVLEKITPEKPRSMHEFEKIIKHSLQTAVKRFQEFTSTYPDTESIRSESKKFQMFLISKCKSKQAYFRFLNNCYSFEYIYSLEKHILSQLSRTSMSVEDCVSTYMMLARGSYTLEGLEILYELVKIPEHNRNTFLDAKALTIRSDMQKVREQLIKLDTSSSMPLISDDFRSTTISFLNAPEAVPSEYLDSSFSYDLDSEVLDGFSAQSPSPPLLFPGLVITNNYIN